MYMWCQHAVLCTGRSKPPTLVWKNEGVWFRDQVPVLVCKWQVEAAHRFLLEYVNFYCRLELSRAIVHAASCRVHREVRNTQLSGKGEHTPVPETCNIILDFADTHDRQQNRICPSEILRSDHAAEVTSFAVNTPSEYFSNSHHLKALPAGSGGGGGACSSTLRRRRGGSLATPVEPSCLACNMP